MYKALFLVLGMCGFNLLWSQNQASFAWNKSSAPPPASMPSVVWAPHIDWNKQLFPSFLLSIATTDPKKYAPGSDYLGDPKGVIGFFIKSTVANTRIKINIEATRYTSALSQEYTLPKANLQYVIYPTVAWNYDLLRQNKQTLPLNFTYTLFVNGTQQNKQTCIASLRGIGDCPLAAVDYQGKTVDLRKMFAAYVNEDHPKINELLAQALQKKTVNSFNGYQGKREEVVNQVFAIWRLLRDKGMKYSDIATTSRDEDNQVISQRVRTFQEAITTAQANCIDGTIVFASLMRAIGLQPLIILVPGHAMLGFYVDGNKEDILVLETTLIGELTAGSAAIKHEFAPTILAIGNRTLSQTSAALFLKALNAGYTRLNQVYAKDAPKILLLDIAQIRSLYKPIGL
jgi:hypothetical protein